MRGVRLPREIERRFWRLIKIGMSTDQAGEVAGASMQTGRRWFRDAGGMPSLDLAEPSGRYLSLAEREDISIANAAGLDQAQIARLVGRHPSTIGRELTRTARLPVPSITKRASRRATPILGLAGPSAASWCGSRRCMT